MERIIKIAFVIKTEGLEYDDRVRKELQTIQKIFPDISFKIFAMLPDNNEVEGMTDYGVPYKSVFIPARDKYPSASKTTLKAWQFYQVVKKEVMGYDAVWVANVDAAFVPMFLCHKRILWDLHELPLMFTGKWPLRQLLRHAFNRCKVVVHANPQRVDYLNSIGVIRDLDKHFALRNYPNFGDVDSVQDDELDVFIKWKAGRECVYLQGLSEERRAAYESIAAVLRSDNLTAVVVGRMFPDALKRLKADFGEELLKEKIYFVGKVPQLKIPQYVSECQMSLVFYKNVQPNNWYCEANRFYQAVILGVPVVVGANPPMRELVEKYGYGISIDDDGSDVRKIMDGIAEVKRHYSYFRQQIEDNKEKIMWSNQESTINTIITTLLG